MRERGAKEIVIETSRRLVIRRQGAPLLSWCGACNTVAGWVTPDEATILARVSSMEIYRRVESGAVHHIESPEGLLLICLNSLMTGRGAPPSGEREVAKSDTTVETGDQVVSAPEDAQADSPEPEKLLPQPGGQPDFDESKSGCQPDRSQVEPRNQRTEWELNWDAFSAMLARLDADQERAAEKFSNEPGANGKPSSANATRLSIWRSLLARLGISRFSAFGAPHSHTHSL